MTDDQTKLETSTDPQGRLEALVSDDELRMRMHTMCSQVCNDMGLFLSLDTWARVTSQIDRAIAGRANAAR